MTKPRNHKRSRKNVKKNVKKSSKKNNKLRTRKQRGGSTLSLIDLASMGKINAVKSILARPDTDVNMLITGEKTGRLDEQLKELLQIYERRIDTYFNLLKTLLPALIFICISIYIGFVVFSFYKEYYDNLFEQIDF